MFSSHISSNIIFIKQLVTIHHSFPYHQPSSCLYRFTSFGYFTEVWCRNMTTITRYLHDLPHDQNQGKYYKITDVFSKNIHV
jgi:hypothetical protein